MLYANFSQVGLLCRDCSESDIIFCVKDEFSSLKSYFLGLVQHDLYWIYVISVSQDINATV